MEQLQFFAARELHPGQFSPNKKLRKQRYVCRIASYQTGVKFRLSKVGGQESLLLSRQ
jgi:hypothetical protein